MLSLKHSIYRCDPGYSGPLCEPTVPLPMMLRDDFNTESIDRDNWKEVYGGETSNICGQLVSGKALTFHKVGKYLLSACRGKAFQKTFHKVFKHLWSACKRQSFSIP